MRRKRGGEIKKRKKPPTGAKIQPKRYFVLKVSCPELLTDRNPTNKGHSACENHTNRTAIQARRYFVHQVKCPQLLTERNQAYSVAHPRKERSMKFQENPPNGSRDTVEKKILRSPNEVPLITDRWQRNVTSS